MGSPAPHIIRLAGPWDYCPIARTVLSPDSAVQEEEGPLPAPGRVRLPGDWGATLGGDFRGRVVYTRRFGRPTGLAPGQRVDLVLDRVDAFGQAALNGVWLGEIPPTAQATRFEIARLLLPRNELMVEVQLPRLTRRSAPLPRPGREDLPGGLVGQVRLEIF